MNFFFHKIGNLSALLFIFSSLFLVHHMQAQTVEINAQGERIIRFDDGSWRYFEPADSVYLAPTALQSLKHKIDLSKDHLSKLRVSLSKLQKRRLNLKEAQKQNSYNREILQTQIDSLNDAEDDLRLLLQSLEFELEEMLLRKASMESSKQNPPPPTGRNKSVFNGSNSRRSLQPIPYYRKKDWSSCEVQKSSIPGTDGVRWSTLPKQWFYYTPKLLTHKYPDAPYLAGMASVMYDKHMYYLQIKVKIRDLKAPQNYGWVAEDSPLFILTMNGKTIEIKSQQEAIGQMDKQAGVTRYTVLYALPPEAFKTLRREEISKLRLVWSSGYEDYEIYDIRFLQKQIQCLQSTLK